MNTDALVWPAEAAQIAGVTCEWLRRLSARGVIRSVRMGPRGVHLYDRSDIEALARRRRPPSDLGQAP